MLTMTVCVEVNLTTCIVDLNNVGVNGLIFHAAYYEFKYI